MMQLVWIDIIIFFLIAGAGVILSQRIYRQDMETETSNVFEASFSNIYTTLSKMLDNQLRRLIACVRPTVIVHTYLDGKEIGSKVVQQVTDEVTKDQRNYEMAKGLDTDG